MNGFVKAGLSTAVVALSAFLTMGASAADLGDGWRGSMKDAPVVHRSAGRCYVRGDVGYSLSSDPDVRWPVTDPVTGDLIGDTVSDVNMEDTWLAEVGIGCGSGSRGFRGEFALGYRGKRHVDGEPLPWFVPPGVDPIHTDVTSYTAMFNVYYDLGNFRGFSPYVGAGIGLSYNEMDDVYFTENPALVNRINGGGDVEFAWQLMAGVGYQISDRAILDFGYRYVDLGGVESGRIDSAGFVNPAVNIDDMTAHEFKIGLRYHFGARDSHYVGSSYK